MLLKFNFFKNSIVLVTPLLEFYSHNFYYSVAFKLLKQLKLVAKEVRGTQDTLDEVMVLLREQATRSDLDKLFKVISPFTISCSFQNFMHKEQQTYVTGILHARIFVGFLRNRHGYLTFSSRTKNGSATQRQTN